VKQRCVNVPFYGEPNDATPFYQADWPNFDGTGFSPEAWFDGIGAITLAALGGDIKCVPHHSGLGGFWDAPLYKIASFLTLFVTGLGLGRMVREAKAPPP
jgi:hypothetical protein